MAKVTIEYKVAIQSAPDSLDALKMELAHARRTLMRMWFKDRIAEWDAKVTQLEGMVIDFKAAEKVRKREQKWAETKRKAGYGASNET